MMTSNPTIRRTESRLAIRTDDLPAGVAGRVTGMAVTWDREDSYGTMFAPTSMNRTINAKVAARKVPFLMDHERSVKAHIGVITSLRVTEDGAVMDADVFDTEDGRRAMEYVKAVLAAGAATGLSIGFRPVKSENVTIEGRMVERFTEIALSEISLTPTPAVPGTDILSARAESEDMELLMQAARAALAALPEDMRNLIWNEFSPAVAAPDPTTITTDTTADATSPQIVSGPEDGGTVDPALLVPMSERLALIRQSFSSNH